MRVRFLLGPAGSGKTFRCLTEARRALTASPEGLPLVLVAPKQTTYQLERQFLAEPSLPGYTRLHILSFERLADFIFERVRQAAPERLEEEGRLMVLRGLLAKPRDDLKLFRASARLTGFAQQLSQVLRELQRNQLTPDSLRQLAGQVGAVEGLAYKLQDLATLLQDYLDWLNNHDLLDAEHLLTSAAEALGGLPATGQHTRNPGRARPSRRAVSAGGEPRRAGTDAPHPAGLPPLRIEYLWVDGFAEFSEQELNLLAALMPCCEQATLTFCLDQVPARQSSWLSNWSVVRQTFEACRDRLAGVPGVELVTELLERVPDQSRFVNNVVLQHLERCWSEPRPFVGGTPNVEARSNVETRTLNLEPRTSELEHRTLNLEPRTSNFELRTSELDGALRVAICAEPEDEVTLAAREILRHVRQGGRYGEVSVLVRKLEGYHQSLQRVFSRYEIPFFLDRRESVAHHPLAELTRSALRTVALGWQHDDWFAALKTGLLAVRDEDLDRLENEALARGWRGNAWHQPLRFPDTGRTPEDTERLRDLAVQMERLRLEVVPPFQNLMLKLATLQNKPTGPQLAAALRQFWQALEVGQRLEQWAEASDGESSLPSSVHATVWEQMNAWLENVELAFPQERLLLREWLPILEAGLVNLSVGVIPPAVDQVLIGAIDRSRNPDIKLALVLGLNETVFPARPEAAVLLSEADRLELEKRNVRLGGTARHQLARERYLAYIACTRARQRVVLTSALHDANGAPLNRSPFLSHIRQLFPSLNFQLIPQALDWKQSEHPSELIGPLLKMRSAESGDGNQAASGLLLGLPPLAGALEQVRQFRTPAPLESLAPELAARLYGPVLRTSVSRIEQFAACPFEFFVHSGLRAEERKRFELDAKEQGNFQHEVLAYFHEQLRQESLRWRDLTPAAARERIASIVKGLMASYRDGLLEASEQTRFMAGTLTESLQDFVETLVGWMRAQYRFDPVEVELPFGEADGASAWSLPLEPDGCAEIEAGAHLASGAGPRLELQGRIDRVDLFREAGSDSALCVVVDYKSSQKQLDPLLLAHGLQLQLLAYLNVLRHWPNPREFFGVARLIPVGVFYVNLRGQYDREKNRLAALAETEEARKRAYRHTGRFDTRALRQLDARSDATAGDQFKYRLTANGQIHKGSREALATPEFEALLDSVATNLQRMGRQIYAGVAQVDPYRKGAVTACDQCDYQSICRIDPWTHRFRVLRKDVGEPPS